MTDDIVNHYSYLSRCLNRKFDHFAECVLPVLINVLQSSAKVSSCDQLVDVLILYVTKVMSSSCDLCIRYILEHTHNPRLIPIIANGMSSKATSTRRCVICVIGMCYYYPPSLMLTQLLC